MYLEVCGHFSHLHHPNRNPVPPQSSLSSLALIYPLSFWVCLQWIHITCSFKENIIHFMCKGVLPVCMYVQHMHAVPMGSSRGHQIPLNWSCRWLLAAMWVLEGAIHSGCVLPCWLCSLLAHSLQDHTCCSMRALLSVIVFIPFVYLFILMDVRLFPSFATEECCPKPSCAATLLFLLGMNVPRSGMSWSCGYLF